MSALAATPDSPGAWPVLTPGWLCRCCREGCKYVWVAPCACAGYRAPRDASQIGAAVTNPRTWHHPDCTPPPHCARCKAKAYWRPGVGRGKYTRKLRRP